MLAWCGEMQQTIHPARMFLETRKKLCPSGIGESCGGLTVHILEIKKLNKGKLLVLTDEVGTFPIYAGEAAAYHIVEGGELPTEDWERLCAEVLARRVRLRALHLLERQDRTEAGLRRKLAEGHYPECLIDDAVAYVRSYHYIDDARYASTYIRYHQDEKSRFQLRTALLGRGVSPDDIDRAFAEAWEGDEGDLIGKLLKKRHYDPETADEKEKNRTFAYLLRRGFAVSQIKRHMGLT